MLEDVLDKLTYIVTHAHNISIPEKVAIRTKLSTINTTMQVLFNVSPLLKRALFVCVLWYQQNNHNPHGTLWLCAPTFAIPCAD